MQKAYEFSLSAGELNLQPGVYFVSLSGETGHMVRKIVIK
ncbi:MAG: T9SS type A sorting domain-containing protein [Bacteroidetes bacterium]|nr:T9SS type A sorting domain-containing protein [Bacteroidota bacterium]